MLALFIGLLTLFKYLGFAANVISRTLSVFGLDWTAAVPKLLLPAGISFYFFAAMGYLIDVYRGKVPAEKNFVKSALFLSFFPSLLSGPIARADRLMPQFEQLHEFSWQEARVGLFRFAYGAFLKLLIADRLAVMVDTVFASPQSFGSLQVIAAACAFSIQIYCDFAAYSHMAIGSARAMGFKLTENFNTPYFSRSIAEFWRRWHISLSTWFRDYLYIPLGGNRRGQTRKYINVLIVFAVSGLWHGAATSFLVWGLLNGIYQVIGSITAPLRARVRSALRLDDNGKLTVLWQMLCVFVLATVAWTFFEAGSVSGAIDVLRACAGSTLWAAPLSAMGMDKWEFVVAAVSCIVMLIADEKHLEAFKKIAELCRDKGIDLIVTINPTFSQCSPEIYDKLERDLTGIAPEADFELLANSFDEIGLDISRDLYDGGHLNFYGACKFSEWTGKMLLDKGYSPREQTKENAAAWDDGAQHWLNLRDNAQSAAS